MFSTDRASRSDPSPIPLFTRESKLDHQWISSMSGQVLVPSMESLAGGWYIMAICFGCWSPCAYFTSSLLAGSQLRLIEYLNSGETKLIEDDLVPHEAVQSFGGLVTCRFFLGFVEAAYFVRPLLPSQNLPLLLTQGHSQATCTFPFSGILARNWCSGLLYSSLDPCSQGLSAV